MPGIKTVWSCRRGCIEADPDLTVIVMAGYASVETAVQALKTGAYDYITQPVDPAELFPSA